jgi:hypothetical protein
MFVAPHYPTGRSVWMGKDLINSTDWAYHLPRKAIDQIRRSLARMAGRDPYEVAVTKEEFPLACMEEEFNALREELAHGRGFIVIKGLPKDEFTNAELGLIFRGFSAHFGNDLAQSFYGDHLGDIRDVSDVIVDRNKRRGYHSGGFQTAHTDPGGALDVVGMLSLRKALGGGESLIASAHTVHNGMHEWCPDLLEEFYKGFVLRRPDTDAAALGKPPLLGRIPSFVFQDGWLSCDFQEGYMRRAQENGDSHISVKQRAAIGAFTSISNHPDVMLKMMLEPGDFQYINNRKILHGRAQFEDSEDRSERRHLYRIWLNVPEWPRTPAQQGTLWLDDIRRWEEHARVNKLKVPA